MLTLLTLLLPVALTAPEALPDGVERLLPRGRIAAVTQPVFVPASDADLPDTAWVLGVVIEGQARAFSLNLLNRHEIVNDTVGHTPYAAVW